ncbi:hypothetical protein DSM112329_04986 [Paraconexibacter sp. AEG42_29]|uniref:Uncharacterized protein n=1 Tax=Paraconexibacter sp. AEG42_29 TaxID=2997339 RepID=A0AAU7B2K5_9ACTN
MTWITRVLPVALLAFVCGLLLAGRDHGASSASAAALDLRSPLTLKQSAPRNGKVVMTWRNRATQGRVIEVRTFRGGKQFGVVRRLPKGTSRITIAAPPAGRRVTVKVRACARRGGPCGGSAFTTVVGRGSATPGTPSTPPPPVPNGPVGDVPMVGSCPVRPASDPWNTDISSEPVDPRSDAYIKSIGAGDTLHPDFGSGQYGDFGIPFAVVPANQPLVPIRFVAYPDESDPGPYPIPLNAHIEGGPNAPADGDRHVIVVREGECKEYDLFHARREGGGFSADGGAVWDLTKSTYRPDGWTSADAAGLPILPGLARADEASAGKIRHALRFTVSKSQAAYVPPASHEASFSTDRNLPPMGLRLRLKASFDRTPYTGQARAILDALATYGMIVADNGSDWFISGTPDPAWDDDNLNTLKKVPGSAFEAIETKGIKRG